MRKLQSGSGYFREDLRYRIRSILVSRFIGSCAMLGDGHTRTFFSETLFQDVEVTDNRNP